MEKYYIIKNVETGEVLSKTNSFTSDPCQFLITNIEHAKWLWSKFVIEDQYKVEIEKTV